MKIYLDFDGTVVEHAYPKIGCLNVGCLDVIHKLQKAGHTIILNTYRVECKENDSMIDALNYLNHNLSIVAGYDLILITEWTPIKLHSPSWNLMAAINRDEMFIDDAADNIPLKNAVLMPSKMVDWDALNAEFIKHEIYKKEEI